jgi:phage shock protein A
MRIFARLRNLIRGWLGHWVQSSERRHPEAVYEAAIQQRIAQYAKLRQAAAGVLYMRTKVTGELEQRGAALARLNRELTAAVDADDDALALALINRKAGLDADIERLTREVMEVTVEAEAAKKNLVTFRKDIAELRDEKVRMLAKWAGARARRQFQETMNGLASSEVDIRALAEVRDHINRMVAEVQLSREIGDADLEQRLSAIREAEADASARAQLREMKHARGRLLLPVVVPMAS